MIKKFLSSAFARVSAFALAIMAGIGLGGFCHASNEFSATGTEEILTNALAVPQTVLAWGIPIVLAIVLGVWAIFWLIGKLRKHTK